MNFRSLKKNALIIGTGALSVASIIAFLIATVSFFSGLEINLIDTLIKVFNITVGLMIFTGFICFVFEACISIWSIIEDKYRDC